MASLVTLGNGPALDLIFHRRTGEAITQSVRLPALAKGTSLCLHFARHDSKQIFIATYRDAEGRPYSSQSRHDLSTSTTGFQVDRPEAEAWSDGGSCLTRISRRLNQHLQPSAVGEIVPATAHRRR
jgi:hypothetical protein